MSNFFGLMTALEYQASSVRKVLQYEYVLNVHTCATKLSSCKSFDSSLSTYIPGCPSKFRVSRS
jgi:hypothetical protein